MAHVLHLTPEVEQWVCAQARELGISVADVIQEIVSKQAEISVTSTRDSGKTLKIPALSLGMTGSLDIYDDVR